MFQEPRLLPWASVRDNVAVGLGEGGGKARERAGADTGLAARGKRLGEINRLLLGAERALTDPAGLPGRPWYRHLLYAPGIYTGYGAKTLPGVREALEQRRDGGIGVPGPAGHERRSEARPLLAAGDPDPEGLRTGPG